MPLPSNSRGSRHRQPPKTTQRVLPPVDTWTINSNIVNDIRYGYTRQAFAQAGVGSGVLYTTSASLLRQPRRRRTTIRSVPINTILDTLNYTKGSHSIQVGGTWRLIHNNSQTNANSFNSGNTNPLGLSSKGLPDPSTLPGYTPVSGSFSTPYLEAYANLVGTTPVLTQNINYTVNPGGNTGTLVAFRALSSRVTSSQMSLKVSRRTPGAPTSKANDYLWTAIQQSAGSL